MLRVFAAAEELLAATGDADVTDHTRQAAAAETPSAAEIEWLTRRGFRLAQFTVACNVVEGVVAITAGILSGLVSLIGFGFDSGIESAASVLVGLRLAARLRHGGADEAKERRALEAAAVTFFVLAAYDIIEGTRSLINGETPDNSISASSYSPRRSSSCRPWRAPSGRSGEHSAATS